VPAGAISIAPHAKGTSHDGDDQVGGCDFASDSIPHDLAAEVFGMTKLHRDIAVRLLECVQDQEFTEQATVKVTCLPCSWLLWSFSFYRGTEVSQKRRLCISSH